VRKEEEEAPSHSEEAPSHPLYTRFTNIFGASIFEMIMRPNPRRTRSAAGLARPGSSPRCAGWRKCRRRTDYLRSSHARHARVTPAVTTCHQ
jgi:hypothetical protein